MADTMFWHPVRRLSLDEVGLLAGVVVPPGTGTLEIARLAPLGEAAPGDLAFLDNTRYLPELQRTRATACIVAARHAGGVPSGTVALIGAEPYRAVAQVMQALFPSAARPQPLLGVRGVSPAAYVSPEARLETDVTVEAGAIVGAGAEIGSGTVIQAGAAVGPGVRIGRDCSVGHGATVQFALIGNRVIVHPGVRLGQDGFGFAMGPRGHLKVPQIGRVIIQDDVEIGANTTIDRGSNRDTVIGEGTKIDNGVQIGHNVVVGRHCVIVAQVGIAGSSSIEDFVALGGQSGVAGHLTVGAGAQVAGASAVKDDVPAGSRVAGIPARPLRDYMREALALRRLAHAGAAKDGDETP